uniref:MADS-box domain-containing protein n=1 Tax=Kalanchoe fedtschenkoi TaxID=63787 RepID=A0A7N0UNA6_KALFE
MTRKKVKLAWIPNYTARRAAFRKRRDSLIRKLNEISVLAGGAACGVILSPFEGDPPVFWPPSINEVLERYFSLPELEQQKRLVTAESYIHDEISKFNEIIQKEHKMIREAEVSYHMNSIHFHGSHIATLSYDETSDLFWYFEEMKNKCELRLNQLDPNASAPQPLHPEIIMMQEPQMGMVNTNDPTWLTAGNPINAPFPHPQPPFGSHHQAAGFYNNNNTGY